MPHNELLLGNVLVRLLGLQAYHSAELVLLYEALNSNPGIPHGLLDGVRGKDPDVQKRLDEYADKILHAVLCAFGAGLRQTAPDMVEFTSLADELEEYAARFNPAKEASPGQSAPPDNPEEEWLRRVLDRLDPPDGIT